MLYQPRVRRVIAGLAVLPMTAVGAALALTPAVAQDGGEPFFAVSPIEPPDHMWGLGWLSDSEVQIDIDDPAVGGEVDFTTALPTDGDGRFEVYDLPFDIQAGHIVTVSQSADVSYLKTHDVIDLTVTEVDPVTDTVSGIGAADSATHVNVGPSLDVVVTSDGTGAWTADLGSEGFDIVPGTTVYVYQADDDFDQTQIDVHVPDPFFAVSPIEPPDHMWGLGWLPDTDVQVDIDNPAVGGAVDFTTALPTDGDGRFEVYDLPFDIQAGQTITVSQDEDADYVKTHDVIDLTVTAVDPVADTVSGVGAADTATHVNVGPSLDVVVTSDGTGAWTADVGSEGFDIVPGTTVYVYQADDDFDQTQIDFAIPDGNFNVAYAQFPPGSSDFIHLHGWQAGIPLTISIDDPTVPGGVDYEVTGIDVASTDGFNVDIGPAFDIETGHVVTVSDGHVATSLVVTNLEIISADPASDVVTGVAEPGKPVFVTPDYAAEYWVDPAWDGSWQVHMGDYDLQPGGGVAAQQYDETWNATQFDYNIPEAQLLVSPFSPPVDNDATNVARAGRTVPFKFRVTDENEAPVTDLIEVDVIVELTACEPSLSTDAIEQYVSSTGLVNKGDGYYQYNVKTNKAWAGQCGRLGVDVGSSGIRTADFLFR